MFSYLVWMLGTLYVSSILSLSSSRVIQTRLMMYKKKYPISSSYYERYIRNLNSNNITIQNEYILNNMSAENETEYASEYSSESASDSASDSASESRSGSGSDSQEYVSQNRNVQFIPQLGIFIYTNNSNHNNEKNGDKYNPYENYKKNKSKKSDNFEVIYDFPIKFKDIGGYDSIKLELKQCIEILNNYTKYEKYNVRIPRGLVLEGPPGTGKTLIAKGLAGEANTGFISVSGPEFQEKYVGVGASKIRELFSLADKNTPCIIFIDEIDAVGKKRSSDGEAATSERDSTLNQLLICLDGFNTKPGVFLIGATNRIDMLDPALLRPGRIDKRIYIGLPDSKTRKSIIEIHSKGKPMDPKIELNYLIDIMNGLSGAQIENVLNEAMLNALRDNRDMIQKTDIEMVMNKLMVGWQPNEHEMADNLIEQIAIHEMGHAIVGILSKHHSKLKKVVINFSSPRTPGFTQFEENIVNIYTREALFEHLMILLGGRIAEEIFYNMSITSGAMDDLNKALELSNKMITFYGMGKTIIYPSNSEKYKQIIDDQVMDLINNAYRISHYIIENSKEFIQECSDILKRDKVMTYEHLTNMLYYKYPDILNMKIKLFEDE